MVNYRLKEVVVRNYGELSTFIEHVMFSTDLLSDYERETTNNSFPIKYKRKSK